MALKIELEVAEVNTILRVLGKHPFDEVVTLISKIKTQGEAQIAEQTAAQAATPTTEETSVE